MTGKETTSAKTTFPSCRIDDQGENLYLACALDRASKSRVESVANDKSGNKTTKDSNARENVTPVVAFRAPFLPLSLPFHPAGGVRFLARDPFEETRSNRVRYEEMYIKNEASVVLPLADLNITSREYVRGLSRSTPYLPGRNGSHPESSEAEGAAHTKNEIKSEEWTLEYENATPLNLEIPGFVDYIQSLESDEVTALEYGIQEEIGIKSSDDINQISKINISNLFEGILPAQASEEDEQQKESETSFHSSTKKAGLVQDTKINSLAEEDSASSFIEQVLDGEMDLSTALEKTSGVYHDQNRDKIRDEKVWAVRRPIQNLDEAWANLEPYLAKTYQFNLDTFQKEAIIHMEEGNSVFVAAHTSAGKTVAAEYAFALAEKHCTRAVYTSPIKTISNQKFRDFSGQFEVGLLTGDVSIKPESTCLIMTTEILRSMLYKGADIIRDIEWVIFDEVHYVNDAERGVVWEEVIIMLPDHIKLLLLSATVPNVLEFANWVGKTKQKTVYVTGTNKRPVPLEHALYYGGKFYTVCSHEQYDPSGWRQANDDYNKKTAAPKTKAEAKQRLPTGRGGPPKQNSRHAALSGHAVQEKFKSPEMKLKSERSQWGNLIEKFRKKELLPMVAFCFSKKRCDALVDSMQSLDLTTGSEKSEIHIFCDRAFSRLSSSDRRLPQLLRIKEMLKRGVGIHHAGLLPIVKEVVEMLFCRGLTKVLFATETFAMGVNAPAKAVVFQSTRKHDGRDFRNLLPGEYTQMAGRAGRRGLDSVGTVVVACWDSIIPEIELKRMLTGSATKLESQFRLTYSMILNLLRVEDLKVEDMLRRSFAEFHALKSAPEEKEAIIAGQKALTNLEAKPWVVSPKHLSKEEVEDYVDLALNVERITLLIQEDVMTSRGASSALMNGRIVLLARREASLTDVGVVLKAGGDGKGRKKQRNLLDHAASDSDGQTRVILRLVKSSPLDPGLNTRAETLPPAKDSAHHFSGMKDDIDDMFGGMKLKAVSKKGDDLEQIFGGAKSKPTGSMKLPKAGNIGSLSYLISEEDVRSIVAITKSKIEVSAEDILTGHEGKISLAVQKLQDLHLGDVELMDPVADFKVSKMDIVSLIKERQLYLQQMMSFRGNDDPILPELVAQVKTEKVLMSRLKHLIDKSGEAGLSQMPEFLQRVRLLQKMGYVRSDKTVTMKGRVACEINSGSELVGTELIFGGILSDLSPQEAVALLSALVFQDKTECNFLEGLPEKLAIAYEKACSIAWFAGEEQAHVGLDVSPDEFVNETLNFGLLSVVYHWACGMPFAEICGLTDVMEGSIVRCIVRLDETCREFRDAARVMGDMQLYKQMQLASESIKRDIVFAASLYIV